MMTARLAPRLLGLSGRAVLSRPPASLAIIATRGYRGYNRIEDMMTASESWHNLEPTRPLGDEAALRAAFDRLDLDGSGKIDKSELRSALLARLEGAVSDMEVDLQVDEMISWADMDNDGLINYEEYARIITAGCAPSGERATKEKPKTKRASTAHVTDATGTIYL